MTASKQTSLGLIRALWLVLLLSVAAHATAYERFVSPDSKFEAYTTPNSIDGSGMKLFLRRAHTHDTGLLLARNGRWIDAKWSPDSRFLAIVDHLDGHIADVYVFGIRAIDAALPQITLYYQSPNPNTYDVKWDVVGWRLSQRSILLDKEVRDPNAQKPRYHKKIVAHIGTTPLSPPKFNET